MSNDKMNARYSILMAGQTFSIDEIGGYLKKGLKVIWFGDSVENEQLEKKYVDFKDGGFLCLYLNENLNVCICDGKDIDIDDSIIYELEKVDQHFNAKQYLVEHYPANKKLMVKAGAGSGKTHVMIDRIMYLMHMCEDFSFSDVAMITFTNKATDNMRHRLIKTLNSKYELTGELRYLDKIEEFSQISISTIHSFFKSVIVEIGPMLGYGTNIQLKSFVQEKKNLLRDLLDNQYKKKGERVESVIGLPIHVMEKLALEYWEKLDNNGISETEVKNLSWGDANTNQSKEIQKCLEDIFRMIDEEYDDRKYINNAISMKDIIHELSRVINNVEITDYISHKYKYMFIDEFQDSDNVQIQTMAILSRIYGGCLFVVGDIKQSIYRFRGATDSAFQKLLDCFNDEEKKLLVDPTPTLTKNYRTAKDIMDKLHSIFMTWGDSGYDLLKYNVDAKLVPTVYEKGIYKQIPIKVDKQNDTRKKELIAQIKKIFKESKYKEVVCLTRKNSELRKIREWCEEEKIVCLIKEKGTFYSSDAILDFCELVEAFYYENEPMYIYNYLNSSYHDKNVDLNSFEDCNGDKLALMKKCLEQMDNAIWEKDKNEFRNKPVLTVIRRIVDEKTPVKNYGIKIKSELLAKGYPDDKATEQAIIDTKQYDANLRKLLQILTGQFGGDFSSLGDVCEFIRLKILTDNEEELADLIEKIDGECVKGYTVHGAKGLEFENVLLPFMNNKFYQAYRSEILISKDHKEVGWIYRPKGSLNEDSQIKNENYDRLLTEEKNEVAKEETRLLYVAMTRAVYGLYCFPVRKNSNSSLPDSWAELLPRGLDDAKDI